MATALFVGGPCDGHRETVERLRSQCERRRGTDLCRYILLEVIDDRVGIYRLDSDSEVEARLLLCMGYRVAVG